MKNDSEKDKTPDYGYVDTELRSKNAYLHEEFGRLLPKLIQLCHPDKHNNSTTAVEVTQWLNQQRPYYRRQTK